MDIKETVFVTQEFDGKEIKISCLNFQQRKMLLEAIARSHPEIIYQVAEAVRANYLDR